MGKVIILSETTKEPISLIGEMAGICYGTNTTESNKNYVRGLDCLASNHGRTLEFPQIYLQIQGYSARVIRELYTHIGGAPTRLQESTRYIDYSNGFNFIIPPNIQNNRKALDIYLYEMDNILFSIKELISLGIPKEDVANLLPLGMTSDIVIRTNLRQIIDMSHQRKCGRAYWEFRELFADFEKEISKVSPQWEYITKEYFVPKCKVLGYCPEKKPCSIKN